MSLFRGIAITNSKLPFFRLALTTMVAASFCLAGASLLAQDQTRLQTPIYGTPLMTDTEIARYRSQLSALKTPQERDAYVQAHQTLMQARAAEKGLTLQGTPAGPGKAKAGSAGAAAGGAAAGAGSGGAGAGGSGGGRR